MTDLIVSMLYIIALAAAIVIPTVAGRGTRNYLLDKEDEILHELTACCED